MSHKAMMAKGRQIQEETPKAEGIIPINMATAPTVSAYGIWVRT